MYAYTVVPLFFEIPYVLTIRFLEREKLNGNCFCSHQDFGTRLTAKHVMNAYLSKNNNKVYGIIYFV